MHVYHIQDRQEDEHTSTLVCREGSISLPKNKITAQFTVGQKIIVLRDEYLDMEDVAYICNGQLYLNKKPYTLDKWGCQCLIEYVPGIKNLKLDRFAFKIAIALASGRRGLSIKAARDNLLQIVLKGR